MDWYVAYIIKRNKLFIKGLLEDNKNKKPEKCTKELNEDKE